MFPDFRVIAETSRQRINSQANSSSSLKWTKTLVQSSKEDFSYQPVNELPGGYWDSPLQQISGK
jgi:hypothetical protein